MLVRDIFKAFFSRNFLIMSKLDGKIILITGASKGIGLGCAISVLRHGGKVAVVARAAAQAQSSIEAAGLSFEKNALAIDCDVRDSEGLEAAFGRTVDHFGQLDGLINNAGWHPPPVLTEDTSLENFEELLRLNLTSTFLCCKYAIPHLKKTQGAIVNMSSAVALFGQTMAPAYVASKAGQIGLTRALALDLAPFNVRVNAVCPAGVLTPLLHEWASGEPDPAAAIKAVDSWHALGRMATVEEIGEVCAFLLSSEASFFTGQAISPDGGASLGYGVKS